MNIFLKSTMLAPLFLCLITWHTPEALFVNGTDPITDDGGHIEQLTSMLIAESDFPDGEILFLRMTGPNGVYSFGGCKQKRCTFDISDIAPGPYLVEVVTNKDVFRAEINIEES